MPQWERRAAGRSSSPPTPTAGSAALFSVRAQEAAASARCTRNGDGEATGPATELLSKALQMTFCGKVPKALFWIQCFSHSLEASGQEEGEEGLGGGAENCPLFLPLQRGIFSHMAATRLDKQPSMHTHVQAAQHHSHLSLSPENSKLPFQRDVPSVFSPNLTHPMETQPLRQVLLP